MVVVDIDTARETAVNRQLRNEYVEVSLLNVPLRWRVDYRYTFHWQQALFAKGCQFIMVDTRNGVVMQHA